MLLLLQQLFASRLHTTLTLLSSLPPLKAAAGAPAPCTHTCPAFQGAEAGPVGVDIMPPCSTTKLPACLPTPYTDTMPCQHPSVSLTVLDSFEMHESWEEEEAGEALLPQRHEEKRPCPYTFEITSAKLSLVLQTISCI